MRCLRNLFPTADRRGLSLVELMVAITMFGIVIVVVFSFLTNSRRSYSDMSARVEQQQGVRAVLALMTREIRSAGCDPALAGFNVFQVADAAQFQCRMDLDGDGALEVTEPAEDVTYAFDAAAGELTRNPGSGPQTLLRGVTGVEFRYFDAAGVELAARPLIPDDRDRVRFVQIDIRGLSERGEPLNYVTRVFVRNG